MAGRGRIRRAPRKQAMLDLSREKDSRHRIHDMTWLYGSFLFSDWISMYTTVYVECCSMNLNFDPASQGCAGRCTALDLQTLGYTRPANTGMFTSRGCKSHSINRIFHQQTMHIMHTHAYDCILTRSIVVMQKEQKTENKSLSHKVMAMRFPCRTNLPLTLPLCVARQTSGRTGPSEENYQLLLH